MSKEASSYMRANTLACVIELSLGKVTTVELRNESFVTGKITEVKKASFLTSRCFKNLKTDLTVY